MFTVPEMHDMLNDTPLLRAVPGVRRVANQVADHFSDDINQLLGDVPPDVEPPMHQLVVILDDSTSMRHRAAQVVACFNDVLLRPLANRQDIAGHIMMAVTLMNHGVQHSFTAVDEVPRMAAIRCDGGTPLRDRLSVAMVATLLQAIDLHRNGFRSNITVMLLTDGCDEGYNTQMSVAETRTLLEFVNGIRNCQVRPVCFERSDKDFRTEFGALGLPADQLLLATDNPADIVKVFTEVTQGIIGMTQGLVNHGEGEGEFQAERTVAATDQPTQTGLSPTLPDPDVEHFDGDESPTASFGDPNPLKFSGTSYE